MKRRLELNTDSSIRARQQLVARVVYYVTCTPASAEVVNLILTKVIFVFKEKSERTKTS